MPLQPDQKALVFLGAIAVLGAGVRVVRAARPAPAEQPALEQQARSADSARRTTSGKRHVKQPEAARRVAALATAPGSRGKPDLDIATVSQIDSLPGMSPTLSKRIVADRSVNGPFVKLSALRRVKGVSVKLLERIDTLVTFSGTIRSGDASDTAIAGVRRPAGRRKPARQRVP